MNDGLLFALLLAAVGAGWWLGRHSKKRLVTPPATHSNYYQGLNYLLDAQPDAAIDAFIDGLDVSEDTVETHLAVGNTLRKRGEVDRAIRVHQNLLSRSNLSSRILHRAHLELARDYISAGLLDRAERLLQDLAGESAEQRQASLNHLVAIYEQQNDWEQAIAAASATIVRKPLIGSSVAPDRLRAQAKTLTAIAHYHCELAQQHLSEEQWQKAHEQLQQALMRDKNCVRASLLMGQLELDREHPKAAIKALRQVSQQDPAAIPETVALLRRCYDALDDAEGLSRYLQQCLQRAPSATLVLAVAEHFAQSRSREDAASFLAEQLRQRPSLRGVSKWLQWQMDEASPQEHDDWSLLQTLLQTLISERPIYRCRHCGLAGKQLHWHCPGCKQWGTTTSIRGLDGE